MTYIEEYYNKIMSGEIVACHRIKQVYSMLVDKLHHPEKYEPYIFDEELAKQLFNEFISCLDKYIFMDIIDYAEQKIKILYERDYSKDGYHH